MGGASPPTAPAPATIVTVEAKAPPGKTAASGTIKAPRDQLLIAAGQLKRGELGYVVPADWIVENRQLVPFLSEHPNCGLRELWFSGPADGQLTHRYSITMRFADEGRVIARMAKLAAPHELQRASPWGYVGKGVSVDFDAGYDEHDEQTPTIEVSLAHGGPADVATMRAFAHRMAGPTWLLQDSEGVEMTDAIYEVTSREEHTYVVYATGRSPMPPNGHERLGGPNLVATGSQDGWTLTLERYVLDPGGPRTRRTAVRPLAEPLPGCPWRRGWPIPTLPALPAPQPKSLLKKPGTSIS